MRTSAAESIQARARRQLELLGWQTVRAADCAWGTSLLKDVLKNRLGAINSFEYDDRRHRFDEKAIDAAVNALAKPGDRAMGYDNERVWRLLRFGISMEQTVDGHPGNFTVHYIDWTNPENNAYHLVSDLRVEGVGAPSSYTPDITLFVNGIPFVVIECKDRDSALEQLFQAQAQGRAYQLFRYAQLLIALQEKEGVYGAVGSTRENWQVWTGEDEMSPAPAPGISEHDLLLGALCRPGRLLEWASTFTFFEAGVRRIARPHQFCAVQDVLKRVLPLSEQGFRFGGVVWQAPGTGKSATMMMTAVAILEKVKESNTHVVLLSDRLTLEDQLLRVFSGSGIECRRANTGRELLDLLENSQIRVITTLIQKFDAAVRSQARQIDNPNIFVLVDEADRSQFGQFAETMNYVLPRACFVGFTSAPTLDALDRFGPLITRPYSMERAVRDGVLLPLYYEERNVFENLPPEIPGAPDDSFVETVRSLEYTRATAADVSRHFDKHFGATPFKGMLIVRSQFEALAYKHELDNLGTVTSEVFIADPRPNRHRVSEPLQDYYIENVRKFGSAQRYEQDLLDQFNNTSHPQILICVDRFVGLDVPRCGVVYLMRRLNPSVLIQAVSRGTRSWGNKTHGLAVDYFNQHQVLADALEVTLDDFDPLLRSHEPQRTGRRRRLPRRSASPDQATPLEIVLPDLPSPETAAQEGYRKVITEGLQQAGARFGAEQIEALSVRVHTAVLRHRKVDWTLSAQARNRVLAAIEDELFQARDEKGQSLDVALIDRLLRACLEVAIDRLS